MKRPWWRSQTQTWVVTLPSGTVKTLGKDEHGEGKKNPPKHLAEKWHALIAEHGIDEEDGKPKDMLLSKLFDEYQMLKHSELPLIGLGHFGRRYRYELLHLHRHLIASQTRIADSLENRDFSVCR